jgi:hypothetical protein
MTKPIKITHSSAISPANNLYLGDKLLKLVFPWFCGVASAEAGVVVTVAVGVGVEAGNIKVIAGSGISVVVVVFDGVIAGVFDWDGALVRPVGEGVTV